MKRKLDQMTSETVSHFRITYDVLTDGRFVLLDSVESAEAEPPSIHVVENWYEEFRDREQD